jgi:hypothetical protein
MHARGPDGQTIEDIQISRGDADQSSGFEKVTDSTRGQALLTLRDDYQAVKNSIRALSMADADTTGVLSSQLFRRVTFLAALNSLQAYARELLQTETGTAPVLEELLARGYEKLRPCLAGRSAANNAAFRSPAIRQ